MKAPIPTWVLLLGHDRVAQREQAEELVDVWVAQLDRFQEPRVPERELGVGKGVEREINRFRLLEKESGKGKRRKRAVSLGYQACARFPGSKPQLNHWD